MEHIPGNCQEGYKIIPSIFFGSVEYPDIKQIHENALNNKKDKRREMEIKSVQSFAEEVVQRQRRDNDRTISLVRRQRAYCPGITEEERNIVQTLDIYIVDNHM